MQNFGGFLVTVTSFVITQGYGIVVGKSSVIVVISGLTGQGRLRQGTGTGLYCISVLTFVQTELTVIYSRSVTVFVTWTGFFARGQPCPRGQKTVVGTSCVFVLVTT